MNYEKLKEIIATSDFQTIYKVLTSQKSDEGRKIDDLKKQWDVGQHAVIDITSRPNRIVSYEDPDAPVDKPQTLQRTEEVARIPVPFQKKIVNSAVSFLFGNPVVVSAQPVTDEESLVLQAVTRMLEDAKIDSKNRLIARQLFRSTEVAEIWYPVEGSQAHEDYGFKTKFNLRTSVFSPWDGSLLFPFFDDYGDMIAFSREYDVKDEEGKTVRQFETYTVDYKFLWKQVSGAMWEPEPAVKNIIGKIPVVYASQDQAEWADVQLAIERLETLLSNHADTNDYNGSPTVVVEGAVLSMGKKGEQGKLLEIETGGKVEYLSWDHAPESIKLEIENLFDIIRSFTQTPDISFDSVKGLGSISGIALKLLFMDAHLKVMDKREIFDPYLSRRINLIKAYLGHMNLSLAKTAKKLNIDVEIQPFMIEDEAERIKMLVNAAGAKPAISQKTLVGMTGLVTNVETEYEQLQKEYDKENSFSISEPTI